MNFTVRLKLLPSEAVYLSVSQMSGCPQMSALNVDTAASVDAATSGDSRGAKCRFTPTAGCHDRRSSTLILNASMAPPLKVGARCGSSARRDLCGGRGVTRVPTATATTGRCPSLGLVLTLMIAPFGTKRANFGHSDKKVGVCNCLQHLLIFSAT
jgi:hypothetical protein